MSFSQTEIERRMANLIRVATIESVDTASVTCRVRIGELVTGDLPWLAARAGDTRTWSAPDVGEQVLVFSPFGDLAQGIVLPSLYQTAHPAPESSADISGVHYKDGAVVSYDEANHKLSAVLPAGATTELISDGGIKMVGNLTLDGDLIQTGSQQVSGDIDVAGAGSIGANLTVVGAVAAAGVTSSTSMTTPVITVGGIDFSGHTHPYTDSDNGSTATKSTGGAQ